MKLSEFKKQLQYVSELHFQLPDSSMIPAHFHITEVGQINKNYIDCGGTIRNEKTINIQIWEANDIDHRLTPDKLIHIIRLSEKTLRIEDAEIEIEYQHSTVGKYGLISNGNIFILTNTQTNCLTSDSCGIPSEKLNVNLADLNKPEATSCRPGQGCC